MTLRRFLDTAQAILVHELVRGGGMDLVTALESTRELAAGRRREAETNGGITAAQNDAALAELQQALGGVAIG